MPTCTLCASSWGAVPASFPGSWGRGLSAHGWGRQYASLREAGTVGRSRVTQALPGRLKGPRWGWQVQVQAVRAGSGEAEAPDSERVPTALLMTTAP